MLISLFLPFLEVGGWDYARQHKMAEVWMLFSLFLPFLEKGGWDYGRPPASIWPKYDALQPLSSLP
jgi:hypothetical protein